MESTPPPKSSSPFLMQPSSSGSGYIQHTVSRFDTLAGVAIKYGVEVADIKRMNGLTTDIQMFALKSLQIPLPGRHPPSPIMSNGHDTQGPTSSNRRHSDFYGSLKLSSYYYGGVKSDDRNGVGESRDVERKCRSFDVDGGEKAVRRRKSDVDLMNHSPHRVRKSSSTPSFQDSETRNTMYLQLLSTRPMFDGIPNPKKKAARD